MSIKQPKIVPVEDPDKANKAIPTSGFGETSTEESKSAGRFKSSPNFEQQLEEEINRRVKKEKLK